MATRVQGGTLLQTTGFAGPGTITYSAAAPSNFTVGNLVVVMLVHYSPTAGVVTGVSVNGTPGVQRTNRANPTNPVNQVEIWDCTVASGGAREVAVTVSETGSPDGHFVTGSCAEFSSPGTLAFGAAATPADGNDGAPTVATAGGAIVAGAFVVADGGTRVITQPSGYTSEFNEGDSTNFEGGAGVTRLSVAAGSIAWSMTNGTHWSAVSCFWDETLPPPNDDTLFFGNTFL